MSDPKTRFCTNSQHLAPVAGGVMRGRRWICAACLARMRAATQQKSKTNRLTQSA